MLRIGHFWHYRVQKLLCMKYRNIPDIITYESAATAFQCYRKSCSGQCCHDYVRNGILAVFTLLYILYTAFQFHFNSCHTTRLWLMAPKKKKGPNTNQSFLIFKCLSIWQSDQIKRLERGFFQFIHQPGNGRSSCSTHTFWQMQNFIRVCWLTEYIFCIQYTILNIVTDLHSEIQSFCRYLVSPVAHTVVKYCSCKYSEVSLELRYVLCLQWK